MMIFESVKILQSYIPVAKLTIIIHKQNWNILLFIVCIWFYAAIMPRP